MAPFVGILVKVIIPCVADRLDRFARNTYCCCRCCDTIFDGFFRIFALIFTHDGGSVKCLEYIWRGWPFSELKVKPHPEKVADEQELTCKIALRQSISKPFEPLDELLELKLNFLWVLFFSPLMPMGVLPTLVSRLLEVRAKLTKLLFVRRRIFPNSARSSIMHDSQYCFVCVVVVFAVFWYLILALVTYNDNLYEWFE